MQKNSADCGLFLLNYAYMFFQDPEKVARQIEERVSFQNWFDPKEMKYSRATLKEILSEMLKQSVHVTDMASSAPCINILSLQPAIDSPPQSSASQLNHTVDITLQDSPANIASARSAAASVNDDKEIVLIDGFPC